MRPFLSLRRLSFLVCGALLTVGGLVEAAINNPSGAAVLVLLQGTAGLHIEGVTHELALAERDGEVVFRVPLAGLDTGIGLRNRHLRGYLDVTHFPDAELRVPRNAVVLPPSAKPVQIETQGILTLHGISKACSIRYRAEQAGPGELRVHGTTRINMRDFGIDVPSYLGVSVEPSVEIQVDFSVHDV